MKFRLAVFIAVFVIINAVLVPLVSLYGVRVCPVLNISGFWFGCAYTTVYVSVLNLLNAMFLWIRWKIVPELKNQTYFTKYLETGFSALVIIYVLASVCGLVAVKIMLHRVGIESQSRAPQVLVLLSILLGVLQAYAMNWVEQKNSSAVITVSNEQNVYRSWFNHVLRVVLPLVTAMSVVLHFLLSQSEEVYSDKIAPLVGTGLMIRYTSFLITFIFVWIITVYIFHFLSERDFAESIQKQLAKLSNFDKSDENQIFNYSRSWGLWLIVQTQLMQFTKVFIERSRLLKSFSQFVTSGVAERALKSELNQEIGRHRTLTVLVFDIRDFTKISDILPAEKVVGLLNRYFTIALEIFSRHNVTVDKFVGDGILAYIEMPKAATAAEENAEAITAALELKQAIFKLNTQFADENLPQIQIGCGIHRGELVAGIVGAVNKLEHTIIGDTVNRASRIESLCKQLNEELLISKEVYTHLPADLIEKFESKGAQQVRGLAQGLEVYGIK